MVAIGNIFFSGMKRGRGSAWLWLGAASAMVVAGVSLAEVTGGGEPSLQAAMVTPTTLAPTAATPVVAEPAAAEDARPRPGAEEQRRIFMLLLLNSAGPLRPYSGLSR
ncbi:MAG TPA: hypothetical protein VGU20_17970 [Stellaceae bacterium]|nr:hypothetical protein [Stellaceae bacterium]